MKKIFIGMVLVLSLVNSEVAYPEVTNRIVAIVNNEIITLYELEKSANQVQLINQGKEKPEDFQKQVLFQLIDQKLVDLQIKRLGIQISSDEIEKAFVRFKEEQGLKLPEDFAAALAQGGITEAELRQKIKEQIQRYKLISREIGSKIIIPEARMLEFYEKNKEKFQKTEGVHLALILLKNPENATSKEIAIQKEKTMEIWRRLKKGEDFAELARKVSQDMSASQGGDLGIFGLQEIDATLKNTLSVLKPGEFSEVLQTPQGWQIIKLISSQGAKEYTFEEVKERIQEQFFHEEAGKRFSEWIQKIKDRSYIQILL